jgi:restriction system protein
MPREDLIDAGRGRLSVTADPNGTDRRACFGIRSGPECCSRLDTLGGTITLVSKKRRVRKSPAGRAAGMASGVTLLTVAFILFAAWPLILPGRRIQATSAGLALAGIVVSGVAWWWAMRVAHEQNAAGKRLEELQALSPDAFEEWVAARFRERGYTVELVGTQGDHGIDLIVTRADIQAVVQCKNYRSWSVGEPVLRDLFGAMHASGANHAFLVTTGRLTAPATVWVRGKPIDVWNGEFLSQLSQGVREAGELAPYQRCTDSSERRGELLEWHPGRLAGRRRQPDLSAVCIDACGVPQ